MIEPVKLILSALKVSEIFTFFICNTPLDIVQPPIMPLEASIAPLNVPLLAVTVPSHSTEKFFPILNGYLE